MKKLLIILFLSFGFSSQVFADKALNLWNSGDFVSAIYEWEKKAYQGNIAAQVNIGIVYMSGENVKQDYGKSLFWFEKAARQGSAQAQYNLGLHYQEGYGVEINKKIAFSWFLKAAEQGQAYAQYNVGNYYRDGQGGLTKNSEEAVRWFNKSAIQGYDLAQLGLGGAYYNGDGVKKNYIFAGNWFKKAADQGNIDAQENLGLMYKNGIGFDKDIEKAILWYTKAEINGSSKASTQLKKLYALAEEKREEERKLEAAKRKADEERKAIEKREAEEKRKTDEERKQLEAEKLLEQQLIWASVAIAGIFIWILIYALGAGKREREKQLRMDELARIADRKKKEEESIQREKEEEERRIRELAIKEEEKRIYALQQKKLVYLKADKYLSEFESHLPFKLSANYSDLRVFYDEESSTTQTSLTENQTSFKDGKLWDALISLLVDDHSLDTMSTIYFAKIRSLLDDENYLVIGETDLDINEFFDRSTQLELVDLISSCLMPKPIALFVILHLSREFRYPNEEERAETEFKLEHFIVKENAKVKIQKLFTKFDEYAINCVDSYADISSKEYDELESDEMSD